MKPNWTQITLAGVLLAAGLTTPFTVRAHCDTMDGPVVIAAKTALKQKDITPVLKWVKPDAEPEIKTAFARTLTVRAKGAEARELADQFFFETLVRLHRAGEGAHFTGLKPAGTKVGLAVEEADKALDAGSVDPVVRLLTDAAAAGIRKRFAQVRERKAHADHSVEAGRAFVAAYVDYVHYVDALHQAAHAGSLHQPDSHKLAPDNNRQQVSEPQHHH